MTTSIEISLFGGLQIRCDGVVVDNFMSSKAPALLAYLAVTGRPHQREALAGLLWGEMSDAAAANNLRQVLSNLRKGCGSHLLITRDTVAFNHDAPRFLDTEAFTDLIHRSGNCPPDQRATLLSQALSHYRGDFLEGFFVHEAPEFEEWTLVERVRLRDLAISGLEVLTWLLMQSEDYPAAVATARRLLALDPWYEVAHRQLMLLHARTGHWSKALAQYEACRRALDRELGVRPALETTALYERIRAARQSTRHNIAASATPLIGRERELADLRRRLGAPHCRLITLTGLGGTGKTRLAQEIARACSDRFINGAWMVSLADVDAEGFVPALGDTFNIAFIKGDHWKQLLGYLRQKELLLVLDGFEHLLDHSPRLAEILRFAPDVKLLVTSHERLDIEGEWVVEIGGLNMTRDGESVAAEPSEAMQLFLQCAQRARPDARFDERALLAIDEICGLVGGLPLAIEIAAARTHRDDCVAIAADIRQGMDALASTRRDIPPRQRSLRVVFDSAWARLPAGQRHTLAALSVFRGGFTFESAERVAGSPGALLGRSLVQRDGDRLDLHQVVRQFAAEKLDAADEVQRAHAAYFAGWVAARDDGSAFTQMTIELENVRAAWLWGCQQRDTPVLAASAGPLARYLDVQGRFDEGLALFQQALEAFGTPHDAGSLPFDDCGKLQARLLVNWASFLGSNGRPADAISTLVSCLAYFERDGDRAQAMACLNELGRTYGFISRTDEAAAYFRTYLAAARELDDRREIARALSNLATAMTALGRPKEAEELLRESLILRRELDDEAGLSSTLINLAVALYNQGRQAEEKPLLAEAIEIARRINRPRNLAGALGNLGTILLTEGQYDEALRLFQQGLEIHRNTGYRYGMAIALNNVGTAHYHLGNVQDARYHLRRAVAESRAIGAEFIALDAAMWLAALIAREDDPEIALAWLIMVRNHPQVDPETLQSIDKLIPQIAAGLKEHVVRAAEIRAKGLTLDDLALEPL